MVEGTTSATSRGKEIGQVGPGSFFGELALLDGGPRTATVRALTPMLVLVMDRSEFDALVDQAIPSVLRRCSSPWPNESARIGFARNSSTLGASPFLRTDPSTAPESSSQEPGGVAIASWSRSRWPVWHAVSSIRCTRIQRRLTGPLPNEGSAAMASSESKEAAAARLRSHAAEYRSIKLATESCFADRNGQSRSSVWRADAHGSGSANAEQPGLEPVILLPGEVLHDATHGQIGGVEHPPRCLVVVEVLDSVDHRVAVVVEPLTRAQCAHRADEGPGSARWAPAPRCRSLSSPRPHRW